MNITHKKALITGVTGQDGSYLAEYLLSLGYDVYGIIRRHSVAEEQTSRLKDVFNKITLKYGDLYLKGDCTKIRTILGWSPEYDFESLIKEMVDYWKDKLLNEV